MKDCDCKDSLLKEFPKPTYEQWKKAAEDALKGAPFDKKMLTATAEGITLQPIYDKLPEDADEGLPGLPSFERGARASGYISTNWEVAQELPALTAAAFNKIALGDLNRGQTALHVPLYWMVQSGKKADPCPHCNRGLFVTHAVDIEAAFKGIDLKIAPVHFESGANAHGVAAIFYTGIEKLGQKVADLKGTLGGDPIGHLARVGELNCSIERAVENLGKIAAYNAKNAPEFAACAVNTLVYNKAGASAVEELAAAIATGVEYMRAFMAQGMSADDAAKQIVFVLSVGPQFFMEIAKLRAARLMWTQAAHALGATPEAAKMRVLSRTGFYNKTVHDPYVNMLRTTTEAFSAVVGGADALSVGAFDEVVRPADEFSRRIARNQSLVLSEECELRQVVDPAGGSYFIETLTKELAEKSWALFQEIEKQGGIISALKAGFIQQQIAKTAAARLKKFNQRRENLVGTNLYPNLAEKPLDAPTDILEKVLARIKEVDANNAKADVATVEAGFAKATDVPAMLNATKAGACAFGVFYYTAENDSNEKAKVTALPQGRMAQAYEDLRAASEAYKVKTGKAPAIFLATMGPLRQHKARADFTQGFFQAGGFDIIYPKGFDLVDSAVKAAIESGAPAVVICSTDDTYPEIVPPLTKALKAANPKLRVILAGAPAPECEAAYNEAGLDGSISVRSNHFDTLKELLVSTGVIA